MLGFVFIIVTIILGRNASRGSPPFVIFELIFPYSLVRACFSLCHIQACPEYPEIPGTRCACPRMTEENNTVIAGLDPAIKERDVRLKAEHDVEKRLNMTSCSQLDRNTGCGMNLC